MRRQIARAPAQSDERLLHLLPVAKMKGAEKGGRGARQEHDEEREGSIKPGK